MSTPSTMLARRRLGAALWVGGAIVATAWASLDRSHVDAPGLGYAMPIQVGSEEAGRLLAVDVELHQNVEPGQTLARIDASPLEAELEVAKARHAAIAHEMGADEATLVRRFEEAEEASALDRARVARDLSADRARHRALLTQLAIDQSLREQGAGSDNAALRTQNELDVVEARIAASESALQVASEAALAAARRRGEVSTSDAAALVVQREIERLEARIARLSLSVPTEGQVTWIHREPGDMVPAGSSVLEVSALSTSEVVAYLEPSTLPDLEAGQSVRVLRGNGENLAGELISVGSGPREMPAMLWHNPSFAQWGVPVRVRLDDAVVAPNERLTVSL